MELQRIEPSPEWLVGGGDTGLLIRTTDWRRTPLGPRERWPAALRHALSLVLESRFPNVLLWGREHVVLYNDPGRILVGNRHPRALGRPAPEVWPDLWHLNAHTIAAVLERGEAVLLENRPFPVDRQARRNPAHFTISFSPVRLDNGAIGGALITFVETTRCVRRQRALQDECARAESEAKRERELFAKVVERVPVMVAVYDSRGGGVHLNEELQRVLGWTEQDARVRDLLALSFPDPTARAEVQEFLSEVDAGWRELTPRAKDGTEVPSSWATTQLSDETQVVLGIDLPAQRRVNEQLREAIQIAEIERRRLADSEAQLRAIYEQNPAIVVLSEIEDGRTVEANARFTSMLGFALEEAKGRTAVELGIVSQDRIDQILVALRATGSVHDLEVRLRTKSGQAITGLFSSTVVQVGGKRRLLTVISDISALKAAERAMRIANRRLEEADRRKTEFLAVLSHELRNPLAPIRQSVRLLEQGDPCGEAGRRAIEVIGRQAAHMSRLVDDLLDVMRITRGKITLRRERVELGELVRKTTDDYRAQFAQAGIELEVEVPEAPIFVNGDPARLVQVVGNLLHNAMKFTARGGDARVSLRRGSEGQAVIAVRDRGIGMAPGAVTQLFEPFAQGTQGLERPSGGLGLGLALVKGVIEMHGGTVIGRSEGEGRGAEFVVTLPTDEPPEDPAAPPTDAPRAASSRRILVIEDNEDAAQTLHDLLELTGHDVMTAYTGTEGLELARRQAFDVVLCDLGLPELDGYGVARALRSSEDPRVRSLHLVALSGYALPEDVARSIAAGFDRHLAKPPSLEDLDTILREAPARDRGPRSPA